MCKGSVRSAPTNQPRPPASTAPAPTSSAASAPTPATLHPRPEPGLPVEAAHRDAGVRPGWRAALLRGLPVESATSANNDYGASDRRALVVDVVL